MLSSCYNEDLEHFPDGGCSFSAAVVGLPGDGSTESRVTVGGYSPSDVAVVGLYAGEVGNRVPDGSAEKQLHI